MPVKNLLKKKALVEEFVEGKEYSVEYISYQGKHTFLALTEKFTTGAQYIEFAHKEPGIVDKIFLKKIQNIISNALDSLQIKYGASHSEIKVNSSNDIKIIEIGSRAGGACIGSDLVQLSTGYDFMKMVIDISCGKAPDFSIFPHYKHAFIRFVVCKEDLDRINRYKQKYPNSLIRESTILDEFPKDIIDNTGRYAYAIFGFNSENIDRTIFTV